MLLVIQFIFFIYFSVCESSECKKGYRYYKQEFRYIKVDGASIFYWFFESFTAGEDPYDPTSVIPLIIVPGSPEMSGCSIAVLESGPFNEYGIHRNNSMLRDYHVLYIDAVPGTGFSKVDDDCKECYRTNSSQVATDLVKVVIEFFERKPYLQSVPSFIYAQSYGAQIAVKFGLLLDEAVEKEICKGDFRGVFLISPWISPFHLIESWPEYFYILGYIDENEKYKLYSIVEKIRKSLNKKNIGHSPSQAKMLLGLLEDEIRKSTYNNINFCSVLKDNCPKMSSDSHHHISEHDQKHNPLVNCEKSSPLKEFMNKKVKPQLSCVVSSDISFDLNKNIALQKMENDLFESATREVEMLLEKGVMLMVIAPQFDATHNSIGTGNWIKSLNWRGNQSWYTAPYVSFGLGKRDYCDVSIFRKSYNNLHYITLLKAGHLPYKHFPEIMLSIMYSTIKKEIN